MSNPTSNINIEGSINKLGQYVATPHFWISLIILAVSVVLWQLFKKFRKKWKEKNGGFSTASDVIFDILRFAFIFVVVVILLQLNGINVTALVAGLGVVSAIVGLALQDFLKDIVMGVHILTDKFFQIGDVVRYNGVEGEVISFNIRTTKLKKLRTREVMTICNRNISEIEVLGDQFDLDIDLPYYVDAQKIHKTLAQLAAKIGEIDGIKECLYKGTENFNESSITYKIRYFTNPCNERFEIRRAALRIVQDGLKEAGIPFPYNHLDVELVNTNSVE